MPKRTTTTYQPVEQPAAAKPVEKQEPVLTREERMERILAQIAEHVRRMERRDHWRYVSGYFRIFLHIIPLAIVLGSMWYVYEHGEDLLKAIIEESAKRAAQYSTGGMELWMDQVRQFLPSVPPR